MVVRDRPGLEVLVLQRTAAAVFSPSATVFPGGAVDDDDYTLADRVLGMDDAAAGLEAAASRVRRGRSATRTAPRESRRRAAAR